LYPHERSLVNRLTNKPFVLLGINSDSEREKLKETIAAEQITWRSWWDESPTGPIQTQWQVTQRPTIHILDADGIIRYKNLEENELDGAISTLVDELAGKQSK